MYGALMYDALMYTQEFIMFKKIYPYSSSSFL